jgi:hypothetical protein
VTERGRAIKSMIFFPLVGVSLDMIEELAVAIVSSHLAKQLLEVCMLKSPPKIVGREA